MSRDEFRSRFSTVEGRLGLGYPHVGEEQAAMVVRDDAMLQATYDGWVRAQADQAARGGSTVVETSAPEQSPYGQAPSGQQAPYGQPSYGQPADPPPGQQPPYGQAPYGQPQYGQQSPYGSQGAPRAPFGGAPYQGRQVVPSPTRPFVVALIGVAVGWVFWGLGLGLGIWALRDSMALRRVIPRGGPGSGMLAAAFVLAIVSIVLGAIVILRRFLPYGY